MLPDGDSGDSVRRWLAGQRCVKWRFQLELAPTTGKLHAQGWVRFKTARQLSGLVKLTRDEGAPHWERAFAGEDDNLRYTSKLESRVAGPWSFGIPPPVRDPLDGVELYRWQREALAWYAGPVPDRVIRWWWESEGSVGKTALAKHLVMRGEALYVSGSARDVVNHVFNWVATGKPMRLVVWNVPRSLEGHVSYEAMESVLDGVAFNSKYETGQVVFDPPHVWAFANFAPDLRALSRDRWLVYRIRYAVSADGGADYYREGQPDEVRPVLTLASSLGSLERG